MKKNIYLWMALALFTACQTDNTNTRTSASVIPTETESNPVDTNAPKPNVEIIHVPASILAPMIGLWQYQTVVGVKDAKTKDDYFGRWIDLKGDQTFTSGIWQEQTNAGKWAFDGETKLINFNYNKAESIFDEFQVQGVGQDVIVFKGNTIRTTRGIQIKMVKDNERPVQ